MFAGKSHNIFKPFLSRSDSLKVDRYRRTPNSTSSPAEISTAYSNASKLLADLLTDYDIRLRPGFGGILSPFLLPSRGDTFVFWLPAGRVQSRGKIEMRDGSIPRTVCPPHER